MPPRFAIHESRGYLSGRSRGVGPCSTFTVHDTVYSWRVVGLFRGEDGGNHTTRAQRHEAARERAERLAALLNSKDAAA